MQHLTVIGADEPALCDDEAYPALKHFLWHLRSTGNYKYAQTKIGGGTVLMHHIVLRSSRMAMVHHLDRNGLNNQSHNLRIATRSEVNLTRIQNRPSISEYKGVTYIRKTGRWAPLLLVDGKRLGRRSFKTEIEAAHAYDLAAYQRYGDYAYLNFPPPDVAAPVSHPPKDQLMFLDLQSKCKSKPQPGEIK